MALNAITAADLIQLFDAWKTLFAKEREFLIALDGKVGDSDLGITMSKSFAAAAETVTAEGEGAGIAKLLKSAGAIMARTAPSTMGTLTATGFLRAGKALEGVGAIDTAGLAMFWRAYRDGVAERGKAKVGDKTLLDVLDPIATTLEVEAEAGSSLAMALESAKIAAESALEGTKSLIAQHGKAAAFQEKTRGVQDAGATVACFMITEMASFAAA